MEFLKRVRPGLNTGSCAIALTLAVAALRGAAPVTLSVAGRANASVSMAASGPLVVVVWAASTADETTDVYAAASHDRGTTFGAPVRVNSTPGDARVNGEQPPRVTLAARGGDTPEIAVIWTAKRAAGTTLLTSRSTDGGRSFTPTALVPGTDAAGNRGWETIGADRQDRLHLVWLDHRRAAERDSRMPAMHHDASPGAAPATTATKPDGVAMADLSQLYFTTLGSGAAPRAITGGVCYCCKTAIAFGSAGEIYLAWRHVYPGNLRDMAFTMSSDGGQTFAPPARISEDKWAINGCPEDGPALGVDRQHRVHVVWPTVVMEGGEPVKALFHAVSADGRTFTPRHRLPVQDQANHPQLAIAADGSLAVAWDESGGGVRRVVFARGALDAAGRATFQRLSVAGTDSNVYPVIARAGDGLLAAWVSGPAASSVIRLTPVR